MLRHFTSRARADIGGELQQSQALAALDQVIRLLATTVRVGVEYQRGLHLDPPRAAETRDQLSVLRTQRGHDAARRGDAQYSSASIDVRVQRDQPSQQVGPQQAAAGLLVRLPVDQNFAAPQPRAGLFVVVTQIGRKVGIGVCHSRLDTRQTRLDLH
jgi:hypothetical protein